MAEVNLADVSDDEMILLRAKLDVEMRRRGLALSVGQIGERLAVEHFCSTPGLPALQLAPAGTRNVDALSRHGDRYSIKSICAAKKTGTIYPDPSGQDRQLFEYLLVVKLSPQWSLDAIYQLSWDSFCRARSWDKRMSAWYVATSKRVTQLSTTILEPSGGT